MSELKKFKEFKVICYLYLDKIYEFLFDEIRPRRNSGPVVYGGAITPTAQELEKERREQKEFEDEWADILQTLENSHVYVKSQLSIEKEFILHPETASNLLPALFSGDKLKYDHNDVVAVFNCQLYYDAETELEAKENMVLFVYFAQQIAKSLSEKLKCNTKLLFENHEYSFSLSKEKK